jgi:hypothetical protein
MSSVGGPHGRESTTGTDAEVGASNNSSETAPPGCQFACHCHPPRTQTVMGVIPEHLHRYARAEFALDRRPACLRPPLLDWRRRPINESLKCPCGIAPPPAAMQRPPLAPAVCSLSRCRAQIEAGCDLALRQTVGFDNAETRRGAPTSKSGVSGRSFGQTHLLAADKVLLDINAGRPSQRGSLGIWPMQCFEYPPSGIRDRDAAKFDRLVARLNGFTLNCCEPTTKEAA